MVGAISSSFAAVSFSRAWETSVQEGVQTAAAGGGSPQIPTQLTPEQQREISELQQIDRAVRAHEQAHLAAGRDVVTSGAQYSYTYGPDGKQYAVGGEVGIDTSAEQKPEANIDKGVRIQAAALAPSDPSPQDYRVAAIGSQLESKGRAELAKAASIETRKQFVEEAYGSRKNDSASVSIYV